MRIEECQTCRFFTKTNDRFGDVMLCFRFPQEILKEPIDWCGEWKPEENRLCLAVGRQITKGSAASQPIKIGKIEFGGFSARAPVHINCLRAKGHDGKHADHTEEWE